MKYFFILYILIVSCSPRKLNNPCDQNSKSFLNTLILSSLLGDNSESCGIRFSKPKAPMCELNTLSILDSDRGQDFLIELETQKLKGVSGPPTIDLTSMTGITGSFKYSGGVLATNGKIYAIPSNGSATVLIIDPFSNTVDTSLSTGAGVGSIKWIGGVLAPNGKIYALLYSKTEVAIIDPKSNGTFCPVILESGYLNKF